MSPSKGDRSLRLFITGLKHCGKSTAAPIIAESIGCEAADGDDLMLPLIDTPTVREYYRRHGKDAFMKVELEAVRGYVSSHQSFVISLGGGAADNGALMDFIKASGTVVYLRRAENVLMERILAKGMPAFLDPEDPRGSWHAIYERRDAIYSQMADIMVPLGEYGDKAATAAFILSSIMENRDNGR